MRDILSALAAGKITVDEAESALAGYVTGPGGRFDTARETRRGIPEAILARGKTPGEVVDLCETALTEIGHTFVTRADGEHREAIQSHIREHRSDADVRVDDRAGLVVVRTVADERPPLDAHIGVVTGGTSDAIPAREAVVVAEELGATVEFIEDVGVANLTRLTDQLDTLRAFDVIVVAAGREGALPTVVAGLVGAPVIGLPVSRGYGYGGNGEAALAGMLQSCTVLTVVNIDAGFVAGSQAVLIAQRIAAARNSGTEK